MLMELIRNQYVTNLNSGWSKYYGTLLEDVPEWVVFNSCGSIKKEKRDGRLIHKHHCQV